MKGARIAVWGAVGLAVAALFLLPFEARSVVASNMDGSGGPWEAAQTAEMALIFVPPGDFEDAAVGLAHLGPGDVSCRAVLSDEESGSVLYQETLVLKSAAAGPARIRFPGGARAGRRLALRVRSEGGPFRILGTGVPFPDPSFQTHVDGREAFGSVFFEISRPERTTLLGRLLGRAAPGRRLGIAFLAAIVLVGAALLGRMLAGALPSLRAVPARAGGFGDPRLRRRIVAVAAVCVFAAVGLGFIVPNNTRAAFLGSEDDAFITYRFAGNIDQGRGFRYNADEKCLGTTTPLYTLLLAGLGLFSRDFPLLSLIVGFLSILCSALIVSDFLADHGPPALAVYGGVLFVLFPFWYRVLGMETNFLVFLLIAALAAFHRARYRLSFFVLGLAILTRFESVLLLVFFAVALLAAKKPRALLPALGILLAVVVPWFVFAHFYFGHFLPNTLFVKAGIGDTGRALPELAAGLLRNLVRGSFLESFFVTGFTEYLPSHIQSYGLWAAMFLAFGALSVPRILKAPFLRLYTLWILAYVLGFALLNASRFAWYYVLAFSIFPVLIPLGAANVVRFLRPRLKAPLAAGAAALLCGFPLVLGALNIQMLSSGRWYERRIPLLERLTAYREAADFIEANLPPGRSVAMEEIGVLGYGMDRKIWDLHGLVHDASKYPVHFPDAPHRIPYFLTLMDPDYLLLISHRLGEHIAYANFSKVRDFPIRTETPGYPTAVSLAEKIPGRLIAFGDVQPFGTMSGQGTITGWCLANEEIEAVTVVCAGREVAGVSELVESSPDVRDLFRENRFSGKAVFHIPIDWSRLGPGIHELEFWASNGEKRGIFWKCPVRIEP